MGTYFVYQNVSGYDLEEGEWTRGTYSVTVTSDGILRPGEGFVSGTYTRNGNTIYVSYSDAIYDATAKSTDGVLYIVSNGKQVSLDSTLTVEVTYPVTGVSIKEITLIKPDSTTEKFTSSKIETTITEVGNYQISVEFSEDGFGSETPADARIVQTKFAFTGVDITPSILYYGSGERRNGDSLGIRVTGAPGIQYTLNVVGFDFTYPLSPLIPTSTENQYSLTMPVGGSVNCNMIINTSQSSASFEIVGFPDCKVEIPVLPSEITVWKRNYLITLGDSGWISGSSSSGKTLTFSIKGQFFEETDLSDYITDSQFGRDWHISFVTKDLVSESGRALTRGTYTISIKEDGIVKTTVSVEFQNPSITLTSVPEEAWIGGEMEISGTAEATESIQYYVIGPDFFKSGVVDVQNRKFTINLELGSDYKETGKYYLIVQHPGEDSRFNIYPDGTKIMKITSSTSAPIEVFDVSDTSARQFASELRMLRMAFIETNDEYQEKTITVLLPSPMLNPYETEVVKGSEWVVSGSLSHLTDVTVSVELLPPDYAALPKDQVPASSWVLVSTTTDAAGNWSVSFDTSDLDVDEYCMSLYYDIYKIEVGSINIVAPSPTPSPSPSPDPVTPQPVGPSVVPTVTPTPPADSGSEGEVIPTDTVPVNPTTTEKATSPFPLAAVLFGLACVGFCIRRR